METFIEKVSENIWGTPFLVVFIFMSIYVTVIKKVPQLRILSNIIPKVRQDKNDKDKITSYSALMTILAGTLGTGNITGVATAIAIGGAGSIFWLFISGMFAMALSYAENYIVLKYKKYNKYEGNYGGTMYVLDDVLGKPKLAIIFCIFTLFATVGIGCMVQANSLSNMFNTNYNIPVNYVAILLCLSVTYVIFAGKYKLAKVSSYIVPICTITYVILCLAILYVNRNNILSSLSLIMTQAFSVRGISGGIAGSSIIAVISCGFSRGMFSNEAGMGSASIFTATTEDENTEKVAQNIALGVVVDTLFLCTLTGITIISNLDYINLGVNDMLKNTFGKIGMGNDILSVCMLFFVIATIPCWEYYGEQAIRYLFKSNVACKLFKIIYICCIYIGSTMTLNLVWNLSSIFNALMALPNMYMIYKLIRD